MYFFDYDKTDANSEYYELLSTLMELWEYEIVEFKEATGQYDKEKMGKYFSAISNEANLKNQQYGWLILGVSEAKEKHIVGTNFKAGKNDLLQKFKYEISQDITDRMSYMNIIELYPVVNGEKKRVLMFMIPAAAIGIPTQWKNVSYARNGESTVVLSQQKIDLIRAQERRDWSKQFAEDATFDDLDETAIAEAKENYKKKMNRPHITVEIDSIKDDRDFLRKLKLMRGDKVTNAAIVLLGKPESAMLLSNMPQIMWQLLDSKGNMRDYEIFTIPFIKSTENVAAKIRNLVYRYMPNSQSLFPVETQQYDTWLLRELINNCIAHQDYRTGGRIDVNEFDDMLEISNPGTFIPESIENVLKITYRPPYHRNQLLAEAMFYFNMIDTATSGIKRVFRIQQAKLFPMPDYDLSQANKGVVTVFGKVLDDKYTEILFKNKDLDLDTVFLLDQVQKHHKLPVEAIRYLRKNKLIEGRGNNIYLSATVAQTINEEVEYIQNKGLGDNVYYEMIINFIKEFGVLEKAVS